MAIWNFLPCFDTGLTYSSAFIVDVGGFTVNPGEVWYIDDGMGNPACGIVDSLNLLASPNYTLQSLQTNCYDCFNNNGGYVVISDCNSFFLYEIPISNFGFVPQLQQSYNLTVTTGFDTINGCFTIGNVYFPGGASLISAGVNSGPYANCIECNGGIGTLYVELCLGGFGNTYYVESTSTIPPLGTIVSITPILSPLNVICAEVVGYSTNVADATLNNNYGVVNCEICIEENATKRYIVQCLGGGVDVIWANPLLNVGDVISINTRFSTECYQISGETTDNVTLNTYAFYSALPSCEVCISCVGYTFLYGICGDLSQQGYINTNQYIPINGVFLHPVSGCCQVIMYLGGLFPNIEYFKSFYTFEDCPTCTANSSNYQSWFAVPCESGNINVVTTPTGFTSNSVLLSYFGVVPTECTIILTEFIPDPLMSSNYTYAITNEVLQTSCITCQNDLMVGIALVECGTTNVEYRNISYNDLILISYSYELILRSNNGVCYQFITDGCPFPPDYTPINIIDTFNTCTECITYLPPPVSAGTEYTDCQICCDCTTAETINSVVVPHPQWTNPQGTLITLLDAVQLGGTNGLNN